MSAEMMPVAVGAAPVLAGTDTWVPVLAQVGELAASIASTEFVPRGLRGKPAAVAACILMGRELGLPPMTALTSIWVIEGTPALSSSAMRGLVLAAGHTIRVDRWTDELCTLTGWRRGDDEPAATVTYRLSDAQRAGLSGKQVWRQHPRAMLLARATAELCRSVFPDVIAGMPLSDDMVTDDGKTTVGTVRRRPPVEPADGGPPADMPVPEPVEQPDTSVPAPAGADGPMVSDRQMRMMHALWRQAGVTDRDQRLEQASTIVGRPLTTAKALTAAEASQVIDQLQTGDT